jgi:hypothetical protein
MPLCFVLLNAFFCWLNPPVYTKLHSGQTEAVVSQEDSLRISPALKQYFQHVNLANRAIYNNQFAVAAAQYDSAFLQKSIPFFTELKNAILVNGKLGKFRENDHLLRILMLKKQMDTAQLFSVIPLYMLDAENKSLVHSLQKQVLTLQKRAIPWANELRVMFDHNQEMLYAFDTLLLVGDPAGRKALSTQLNNRKDSADQAQIVRFIQLCKQHGFPTEEKTGVFYEAESEWSGVLLLLFQNFVHFKNIKHRKPLLRIFDQALYDGHLHPSLYATLMDYANEQRDRKLEGPDKANHFMNVTIHTVNGTVCRPFVHYSDELMQEVNTNRNAIGLDSFHISQRQAVCASYFSQKKHGVKMIPMSPYPQIHQLPAGFVKWALDKEGKTMAMFEINVGKIVQECQCEPKLY